MRRKYGTSVTVLLLLVAAATFAEPRVVSAQTPLCPSSAQWVGLPVYDHIVIVVEENKDYVEIIGQLSAAPYINTVLKREGASFTKMFAEQHPSEGNYFWLFSGKNHDVNFDDKIPASKISDGNLATALAKCGRSFRGYAEDLPQRGSDVEFAPAGCKPGGPQACRYARKHVPWISFDNIPNLENDMHDGKLPKSIQTGDGWLEKKLGHYYQWAKNNNSLLIVTFDENHDRSGFHGLTDPTKLQNRDMENRVATIFAGAHIKAGEYPECNTDKQVCGVTHVNVLRTIEAMYGLAKSGTQQPRAAAFGITDDFLIRDVFRAGE
jgi:acid phosphatase